MVTITGTYEGGLRCCMTHGPSGSTIQTDAPLDNHGKAELFSPTDLVGAALGSCVLTVMGIAADRHKIDMTGTKITVNKEMASQPARRIGKLTVKVEFIKPIPKEKRVLLENMAHACPVGKSLHPEIEHSIVFQYPD